MLSYLHGFHAGNHADVFKHAVLTLLLEALLAKPKPLVYLDTHAGAGVYDLESGQAGKTGESAGGIGRFWAQRAAFPELASYVAAIAAHNPDGGCRRYPGSPLLAGHLLRTHDRLILMELHPNEIATLRQTALGDPRIHLHHRDGFEGLPALLPPKPARGLVLIDPPYEVKSDYKRVADGLAAAYARWPTGVYAVWHPRLGVQRDQADSLLRRCLRHVPALLVTTLQVRPQTDDFGLHGSGMAIINPPWQFAERLTAVMPRLAAVLADGSLQANGWSLEWRKRNV